MSGAQIDHLDATPLRGAAALVTGASRGIGRAIAIELGRLGARVFVNYHSNAEAGQETVEAALAAGAAEAVAVVGNVGQSESAQDMVRSVIDRAGGLDLLVNNAGVQISGMLHRMSDEDWYRVIDTNLSGIFFTSRAALRWMREVGAGQIINVASASSFVAHPGASGYVASKHGVIGLTKAMAIESVSRGIRVNAVAPGMTETDMVGHLDGAQRGSLEKLIPMKRPADPREVAKMVAFVATEATYSTGNVFHVSGGVVMG